MSDAEVATLACVGALTRETRHEIQNLLAIAGAWTGYRETKDAAAFSLLLDKGAEAYSRLYRLEKAMALCAAPLERGIAVPLSEAVAFAESMVASRFRQLDVKLVAQTCLIQELCDGPGVVLSLTLAMRYALEIATASESRKIEVTYNMNGQGSATLTISASGASKVVNFWSETGLDVARARLVDHGGDLSTVATSDMKHITLRIPILARPT